jgi:hypothetical protein
MPMSSLFNNQTPAKNSPLRSLLNIATIISVTVVSIKLIWYNIVSLETGALIIIGSVVLVALGNHLSKLVLCGVGVWLFLQQFSEGNPEQFYLLLETLFTLCILLIGIYYLIRTVFKT